MRIPLCCRLFVLVGVGALAGCGGDVSITDHSEGTVVAAHNTIDFGTLTIGEIGEDKISLRNTGTADVEVNQVDCDVANVEIVGDPNGVVLSEAGADDDSDYLDIPLVFTPTEAESVSGVCSVDLVGTESTTLTFAVFGRGAEPNLQFIPAMVDFGLVDAGAQRSVALTNLGISTVTLGDQVLPSGVTVDADWPETLEPDESVELELTLTADGECATDLEVAYGVESAVELPLYANICENPVSVVDLDEDGVTACGGDCDDTNALIVPGAPEFVDGDDNDCDGIADEGTVAYDDDGDGYTELEGDCHDGNIAVYPDSSVEVPGVDADCDGNVNGVDVDGDGFAVEGGDCDDTEATVNPAAPEVVNSVDDNCNEVVDEGTNAFDDDEDGATELQGDCDDADPDRAPGLPEVANGRDEDCDITVDEGTDAYDDDGDGFSENGEDCDDADSARSPGRYDAFGNGTDEDCDGTDG